MKERFVYKLKKTNHELDIDDDSDLIRRYNYPLIVDRAIQEFQGMASVIILNSRQNYNKDRAKAL